MKKYLLALAAGLLPAVSLAQTNNGQAVTVTTGNINNAITQLTNTINLVVPLLLAVAVIFFIVGVIRYIIAKGPGEAKDARNFIIWSVVGLAAILAVWGLAKLLVSFFGLNGATLNTSDYPLVQPLTTGLQPNVPTNPQ